VADRVVTIGLLIQRDIDILGREFTRHFPVPNDDMFDDLIAALDRYSGDFPQRDAPGRQCAKRLCDAFGTRKRSE
jgi:hypothetical protein